MSIEVVVALLVALVVGALLGWFLGSRAAAVLRAERDRRVRQTFPE